VDKQTIKEYFKGNQGITPGGVQRYLEKNGGTIIRTTKGDYLCDDNNCVKDAVNNSLKIENCIELNTMMRLLFVVIFTSYIVAVEDVPAKE
jgi:hypothetical protein